MHVLCQYVILHSTRCNTYCLLMIQKFLNVFIYWAEPLHSLTTLFLDGIHLEQRIIKPALLNND